MTGKNFLDTYAKHEISDEYRITIHHSPRCGALLVIPGELLVEPGEIELNVGREVIKLKVANSGDRPIQVGSHYHFFETNDALRFDRALTKGFRLNIAAGTAVRFEPGQTREIELVRYDGAGHVYGFQGRIMGTVR